MKNVSIILNVILIIAVGILFYLQFSSDKKTSDKKPSADSAKVSLDEVNIAYINQDSLLSNYKFFQEEQDKIEKKRLELDNRLQGRAEGLQEEMQYFQQNRGNMTINQARAQQENLMQKQQNLRMYEQRLSQELMQLNSQSMDSLYIKVSNYMKDYSTEHNLQLVLSYQRGSDVWYAHDAMNITQDVIEGLNQQYEQEKSGGSSPAEQDTTSSE